MQIQKVRFHDTTEEMLWYRKRGMVKYQEGELLLKKNASVFTNTYYNAFSVEKWNKYCEFEKINLKICYKGCFRISIYLAVEKEGGIQEKEIFSGEADSAENAIFMYELPKEAEGVLYFALQAQSEDVVLKEVVYEGLPRMQKDVTIALNICTFKRERELLANIALLKEVFLENKDEELNGRLKVYITDNGKTLDTARYANENIVICPNENVGGAGGFTRGLVEIIKRKEKEHITHTIFMDDDIELEPEALRRTYVMLKNLRKEYEGAFLAGAMLGIDERYIQYENGAWCQGGKHIGRYCGVDLTEFANVIKNEKIEALDGAAWWYCCVPMRIVREDNLPLPIFIHGDDMEYSLRNADGIITLNGIAVRHPQIGHKCVSSNVYYDIRNVLIINACHCGQTFKASDVKKEAIHGLTNALLKYRYKDMYLVCQAVEDFCKGAEWLLNMDAVKHFQEIQRLGYRFEDVKEIVGERWKEAERFDVGKQPGPMALLRNAASLKEKARLALLIVSLNGWLLPAKKETGIFYMNVHPMFLYRKRQVVLFNEESMQGIVLEKRFGQLFEFLKLLWKMNALIDRNFENCVQSYRKNFDKLTSIEYWRNKYDY